MTNLGFLYGTMIATMDRAMPSTEHRFLGKRARKPDHYFGFIASTAIEWLIDKEPTDHHGALELLNRFLGAKLLHFPDDRLCAHVKNEGMELQPTAKGFAYLEDWFKCNADRVTSIQRDNIVEALASPYNTMELVRLERSLLSESLLLSTGFGMWLWRKMLGDKPVMFDGTISDEDKLTVLRNPSNMFNASSIDVTHLVSKNNQHSVKTPFWSTTMMHPSTSAVTQYWDSNGVRLFKSLEFERPLKSRFTGIEKYSVFMCISGKSMWQWIMECTTAEQSSEAAKVVRLFVDQKFVQPINDRLLSWATYSDNLPPHVSRQTFYRFTQRGLHLCAWEDSIETRTMNLSKADGDEENAVRWMMSGGPSESDLANSATWAWSFTFQTDSIQRAFKELVTIDLINREPGLKAIFRKKLVDCFCEEPLRYFDDSQRVLLLFKALVVAKGTVTRLKCLQEHVCKGVHELKRLYIRPGAPFQLNISHELRENFLNLCREKNVSLESFVVPIESIQKECMDLLKEQLTRFVQDDHFPYLPLRSYIVGSYMSREQRRRCHQREV